VLVIERRKRTSMLEKENYEIKEMKKVTNEEANKNGKDRNDRKNKDAENIEN
jgi:rubrerythrin